MMATAAVPPHHTLMACTVTTTQPTLANPMATSNQMAIVRLVKYGQLDPGLCEARNAPVKWARSNAGFDPARLVMAYRVHKNTRDITLTSFAGEGAAQYPLLLMPEPIASEEHSATRGLKFIFVILIMNFLYI